MNKQIRILYADSSAQKILAFTSNLEAEPDISLVGQTCDGYELMELIVKQKPDAVVMGLVLDRIDGLVVLSKLQQLPDRPKILIYSTWDNMSEIVASMGADYFLKPSSTKIVCERLRQLVPATPAVPSSPKAAAQYLETQVTSMLMELGVPFHVRGFKYLRKAVTSAVEDPKNLEGITKTLYPSIADCFETTSCRVERAIRHAIKVTWERQDGEVLKKYFGQKWFYEKNKPTNGEFIAVLSEYILMQYSQNKGA